MKDIPEIVVDDILLTVIKPKKAYLINDYYKRNKQHLKKWEPERNKEFYLLDSWENRIERSYNDFLKGRSVNFVALYNNKMIAGCNFNNIIRGVFQACHLGFSIDKEYQGKGFMYKIISKGIEYMFNNEKVHRIMANHLVDNKRSENLLKRLGFEKEGYAKNYLKINGKWQDHILRSLINNDI